MEHQIIDAIEPIRMFALAEPRMIRGKDLKVCCQRVVIRSPPIRGVFRMQDQERRTAAAAKQMRTHPSNVDELAAMRHGRGYSRQQTTDTQTTDAQTTDEWN